MQKKKTKKNQITRRNIYVKPIDFELFAWAESQRQACLSLSPWPCAIIERSTINEFYA